MTSGKKMTIPVRRTSTVGNDANKNLMGTGVRDVLLSNVIDKDVLGGKRAAGRGGDPKKPRKGEVGRSPYGTEVGRLKDGLGLDVGRIRSAKSCNPGKNERA
jgi:hypothetical protein